MKLKRPHAKFHNQSGATMVEYALASFIMVAAMMWVGFLLEDAGIKGRDKRLQAVSASKVVPGQGQQAATWEAAGMAPCGVTLADEDCY